MEDVFHGGWKEMRGGGGGGDPQWMKYNCTIKASQEGNEVLKDH